MLLCNGTRVEILDSGTRITLPCGAVVPGAPHDTAEYRAAAQRLGYGTDTLAMCRAHDPWHALLCAWLGLPTSYSLKQAAGQGCPEEDALAAAEEDAVLALQRFARMADCPLPCREP
jgi:hypothetical protein